MSTISRPHLAASYSVVRHCTTLYDTVRHCTTRRTVSYSVVQCRTVLYSVVPASYDTVRHCTMYSVVQCTVSYSVVQCRTASYSVVQYRTVSYSAVQCRTSVVRHCTTRRTVSYSVVQCRTASYSVVQCRTVSYSVVRASYDTVRRVVQCRTRCRGPTRRGCTTRRTVSYKVSGPDASGMYDASGGVGARRVVKSLLRQLWQAVAQRKGFCWTSVVSGPQPLAQARSVYCGATPLCFCRQCVPDETPVDWGKTSKSTLGPWLCPGLV